MLIKRPAWQSVCSTPNVESRKQGGSRLYLGTLSFIVSFHKCDFCANCTETCDAPCLFYAQRGLLVSCWGAWLWEWGAHCWISELCTCDSLLTTFSGCEACRTLSLDNFSSEVIKNWWISVAWLWNQELAAISSIVQSSLDWGALCWPVGEGGWDYPKVRWFGIWLVRGFIRHK